MTVKVRTAESDWPLPGKLDWAVGYGERQVSGRADVVPDSTWVCLCSIMMPQIHLWAGSATQSAPDNGKIVGRHDSNSTALDPFRVGSPAPSIIPQVSHTRT